MPHTLKLRIRQPDRLNCFPPMGTYCLSIMSSDRRLLLRVFLTRLHSRPVCAKTMSSFSSTLFPNPIQSDQLHISTTQSLSNISYHTVCAILTPYFLEYS